MGSAGWDQSMHKLRFVTAIAMLVGMTGLVLAQAGTEGPLAAPGDPPHTDAKATKPAKKARHKKVVHRDTQHAREGFTPEGAASRHDIALPASGDPTDPMSFGMKWNGNSDSARETRVQNGLGAANGSGAEVGMKLHF